MTTIAPPYVFRYSGLVPEDKGITGFVVIAESHISVHTFQEKGYAFVDIFSCKAFDLDYVQRFFIEAFESEQPIVNVQLRGSGFPRRCLRNDDGLVTRPVSDRNLAPQSSS